MSTPDHIKAHAKSIRHRAELIQSEACGCFSCCAIFAPAGITEWTDDGQTALCPSCCIDSVIGTASGYPVTEGFLEKMKAHWF